jgi:predicted TIM-barrel fold metal-dependent hydrolase
MSTLVFASRQAAGSTVIDCHVHVFESRERYPFPVEPYYDPPVSPVASLLDAGDRAGVERFVLVQPIPYGNDLSLLIASLARLSNRARGVGVANASSKIVELARMQQAGISALRFVEARLADGTRMAGTTPLDVFCNTLAPPMSELGMHAEVWAPLSEILSRWRQIEKAHVPIVLDHMGGFDPRAGRGHKDFQRLLALLREGLIWIKLAVCRRAAGIGYDAIRQFHDDMVDANSNRLIWATDFPFVRYPGTPPSMLHLLKLFNDWVRDERTAHQILIQNPEGLYRFDAAR